jgi:SCY1-like protein 1
MFCIVFAILLTQVYPHVATGFSDTSAFLRELTLKSMLVLALKVRLFMFMLSYLSLLLILFEK